LTAEDRLDLADALGLLRNAQAACYDFLWYRYVLGWGYVEIGRVFGLGEEAARKRVRRCLELARTLLKMGD
jgi:DNA-directed RNA polymerase specialized sigma24 family protein